MPPEGNVTTDSPVVPSSQSKEYNRYKLGIGIASSLLSFLFLLLIVLTGVSTAIARFLESSLHHPYLAVIVFAAIIGVAEAVLTFPFSFYSGFVLEHRFHLSNQSLFAWSVEKLKGLLVAVPIGLAVLLLLFFCLRTWGEWWWIAVGIGLTVLSVILARLAPILILPLFYTLTPINEGTLSKRLRALCDERGLTIEGIFRFNLSKDTKKANAGFTGIGKTKRIILGDTLVDEFTEDEVVTVFAHELGHYRHHHIWLGMLAGAISTFGGLFVAALLCRWSYGFVGIIGPADMAGLPLLALWLLLYALLTSPLTAMLSRRWEYQADAYAVQSTHNATAFSAALRRLASMNLADPDPHPLVEFLFYGHPSISKRVRYVESLPA